MTAFAPPATLPEALLSLAAGGSGDGGASPLFAAPAARSVRTAGAEPDAVLLLVDIDVKGLGL